jgi:hypothetical protein
MAAQGQNARHEAPEGQVSMFIELHRTNGQPVLVNILTITYARWVEGTGTQITFVGDSFVNVTEELIEVQTRIGEREMAGRG